MGNTQDQKENTVKDIKFQDGSTIENNGRTFAGKTAVDTYRYATLISMLKMEIAMPGVTMSAKMSALKGAENVSGLKFGRGVSGRKKALAWAEAQMEAIGSQVVRED
jgi:hypothetical protein